MTGREAANYILLNHYDDAELVISAGGQQISVFDVVYEIGSRRLYVLADERNAEEGEQ